MTMSAFLLQPQNIVKKSRTLKNDILLDYLLFFLTKNVLKECRLERHELRKLANVEHTDLLNITLREKYHSVLKPSTKTF